MSIIKRIFPFLDWFGDYNLATLRTDFLAGLTVALVLVPQSMAYAQLAGLPAYYGLYAAFLPPMIASLFGSSRQLATGPVAIVSLMTAATLEPLATAGSSQYIAYALILALVVGLFQFSLGILRLGVIVNFLSHPVVNGFTNAAALIIATSQLSKIFGIYVDNAHHHYQTVYRVIVSAVHYTHWPTVGMALISFTTMIVLRRLRPRLPNVLIAVVITTLISWALEFEQQETIKIDQILSKTARDRIQQFNTALKAKEALETHRSASKRTWAAIAVKEHSSCKRCHEPRKAHHEQWRYGSVAQKGSPPEQTLVLHNLAGLLDHQIDELKEEISQHRTALRNMLLVNTAASGAPGRYQLRSEILELDANKLWRLKVGNGLLQPDKLTMSGGGAIVGGIPRGLPKIGIPVIDWSIALQLLAAAIIISLLGFMEAISIAKAMATRTRQKLDPNQELIGQGLANIIGCLGQSYAVSGSFSRSAVNLQAGARTGMANVFSSGVVVIVLLFLAEGLYHLPQAVLASIIMMAVFGLLNVNGVIHAWRTSRFDGMVSMITFVGTLYFAPELEWGIFIGVGLSLGAYLYRSMRPQVIELNLHPDGSMGDASRLGLKKCSRIAIVRFEGPLNFVSTSYLEKEILRTVADQPELNHLLIAGNGISEVDASGEETLRQLVDNLQAAGCEVSFSGLSEQVIDVLKRAHLFDHIGAEHFYSTRAQAIAAIYALAHQGAQEEDCPYLKAMPPVIELSLHEDKSLRNAKRHGLKTCNHIAVFRFDAPLSFANTAFLEQEILRYLVDRPMLRHLVFVSHGISDIDDTGAQKLGDLVLKLRKDGFAISFSGLKEEVLDVLERNQVASILGQENLYPTQIMTIAGIYARAHTGSSEKDCPLWTIAPHLTELSLHDSMTLREADQHHLRLCQQMAVLRFDGALVLSNRKAIQSEFIHWAKKRPSVQNVIFLLNTLSRLERTEAQNLVALAEEVRDAGYRAFFANFNDRAFEDMARGGFADAIGLDSIYPSAMLAIIDNFSHAHADEAEEQCPLRDLLPRIATLSLHADGSLRSAHLHGLALCQRIVALRFDGPLNMASIGYFEGVIRDSLRQRPQAKHLLIAGHTLAIVDSVAAEKFPNILRKIRQEGYKVFLSGLKDEDLELLGRACNDPSFGADAIFATQAKAIEGIHAEAHQGSDEGECPMLKVVRARE